MRKSIALRDTCVRKRLPPAVLRWRMVRGIHRKSFVTKLGSLATRTLKGFVIGYCIFEFGIEVTYCTGPSMEPTIQNGDYIVLEKITTLRKSFKRCDIVVCRSPSDPHSFLCKRLVGKTPMMLFAGKKKKFPEDSDVDGCLIADFHFCTE